MKDSKFLTNLPNGSTSFSESFFWGGGSCFLLEEYGKKCTERQSETKATGESKQPRNFFIIRHIGIIFCSSKGNYILVRGSTMRNSTKFMLVGIFRLLTTSTTFSLRVSPNLPDEFSD
jgi:hypothetical protein